jgi:hypothetical protein
MGRGGGLRKAGRLGGCTSSLVGEYVVSMS